MGLDSTGLVIETVESLVAAIAAQERATIDATIVTEADDLLGQVNGLFAAKLRDVHELAQVAYNALNPDANEGFLLEAIGRVTGSFKLPAKASIAREVELDLDANSLVPAGAVLHVVDRPTDRFSLLADVQSTTAGVYTGNFQCDELGPVVANSGTLTVIATPTPGWNSATNPTDAEVGRDEETDDDFRIRRDQELYRAGSSSLDGVRSDVLAVDDVVQCIVLENVTDLIDVNGLPPGYGEIIVFDGLTPAADNDEIAQAIFDSKAIGQRLIGNTSGTAVDALGNSHTIPFSRPTVKPVYLEFDVVALPSFPGATAFKAAIVAEGQPLLNTGDDVLDSRMMQIGMGVGGVYDITAIRLGFTASPVNTDNLGIGVREIGELDTSRIVVNVS